MFAPIRLASSKSARIARSPLSFGRSKVPQRPFVVAEAVVEAVGDEPFAAGAQGARADLHPVHRLILGRGHRGAR